MKLTTCPLDCFDGCSVVYEEGKKLRGEKEHPITQGYLCPHLNHWFDHPRLSEPRLHGKAISMDQAMETLKEKFSAIDAAKSLFYRGSGNLGQMQSVTKLFYEAHGGVIATGSLCEEGGTYGIEEGRGASLALSPLHVKNSDVVILWGRNASVTNSHMLPSLKGKTLVVIDPVRTELAEKADLFIQIEPRSDLYLAMLLSRVAYMEQMEDTEFIEERTENFDYFVDHVSGMPMRQMMFRCGVKLDSIGDLLHLMEGKKVSILVGLGVQKYAFAHQVLRAIDSFAAMLGLFGKEGCGVGYIDDSAYGFEKPFSVKTKEDSVVKADFSQYDLVFIQGGNPATQMPHSPSVRENLKKAGFVVYFGLHENETAAYADLVIPAKSFLEKEDLKLSYGHEYIGRMPQVMDASFGISEYELTDALMTHFNYPPLLSEKEYVEAIINSNSIERDGRLINKALEEIPYASTFYTDSEKFEFFDEVDDDFDVEAEGMFLLTAKWPTTLNSQFKVHSSLHVPLSLGLQEGEKIRLSSEYGVCEYIVKPDDRLRDDCFLIYSGHPDANMITPPRESDEGKNAIYQEMKVTWEKC